VHTQSHTSFTAVVASVVLALSVIASPALAGSASTPPAFPTAVPSQPGALTGSDRATHAALAQQRYYTSYGTPAPLAPVSAPTDDGGGVDWPAIAIAVGAACLLAGAPIALLMRTRRRTGRARVVV
jgi:hypothetical protein